MQSHYHKSAADLARDELDAAGRVVKSNAEIRQVIVDWEGTSGRGGNSVLAAEEEVPREGTATMLAIEFASEGGGEGGKGGKKKAAAKVSGGRRGGGGVEEGR